MIDEKEVELANAAAEKESDKITGDKMEAEEEEKTIENGIKDNDETKQDEKVENDADVLELGKLSYEYTPFVYFTFAKIS